MSFVLRYRTIGRHATAITISLCIACSLVLLLAYYRAPAVSVPGDDDGEGIPGRWSASAKLTKVDWSVFRSSKGAGPRDGGALSKRFRLAGTFFVHGPQETMIQKAIVDNLRTKDQHLVTEGDRIGDVEVISVFLDRIVLRAGGKAETLWLSFSEAQAGSGDVVSSGSDWLKLSQGEKIISTNEYGALVGENQWVMSRNRLVGYCNELQDHPSRLEKLFDSMKPVYVYDTARKRRVIQGYRVKVEGEADFFKAVGLAPGDVVRNVNRMEMSGKHRAMFWIDMFLKDKANAFTLDVDRGGQRTQLKYLVR